MQPHVGQTVHYVSYGTPGGEYTSQCRAAVVTEVGAWVTSAVTEGVPKDFKITEAIAAAWGRQMRTKVEYFNPQTCALNVMNPTGVFFNPAVSYDDEGKAGGTWHFITHDCVASE